MTTAIQRQENGTIKLTVTIPAKTVSETREKILKQYAESTELPGFRKGKAPKKIVEQKIDEEKLREDILRNLLPEAYANAVKEHAIDPVMNPRIHIMPLETGKDWQFTAETVEMPEVNLNDYKAKIQKITAIAKIAIPGKEEQKVNFDDVVKALLESATVKIPELLLEQETERLLSQTLDEIKKLGLTLDQYLSSTGRTPEQLREEYRKKAEADIKLEFVLQKVAETEKIIVEEKEIDEAIQKAKDEAERKNLEANRYLLAGILRQQKTLDFLKNL